MFSSDRVIQLCCKVTHSRDYRGERVNPPCGLTKVVPLKLFSDIVPSSSADITRVKDLFTWMAFVSFHFLFLFQNSSNTYWRGICDDTGFCSAEECNDGCLCKLPFNCLESIFFSCGPLPFSMCFWSNPIVSWQWSQSLEWTLNNFAPNQGSFVAQIDPLVLVPARWLQLCHQMFAIRYRSRCFPGTPCCAQLSDTCRSSVSNHSLLTSSSLDSTFHRALLQKCQLHGYHHKYCVYHGNLWGFSRWCAEICQWPYLHQIRDPSRGKDHWVLHKW